MLQEQIEQTGENVKFILDVIFNTNIQRILNMYQIQRRIALKIMWDKLILLFYKKCPYGHSVVIKQETNNMEPAPRTIDPTQDSIFPPQLMVCILK